MVAENKGDFSILLGDQRRFKIGYFAVGELGMVAKIIRGPDAELGTIIACRGNPQKMVFPIGKLPGP